jgi:anti-sigma factor (TIGR02949 family)
MSAGQAVSCREAVSRLWEYLDGELEGGQEPAIREHLETCTRCYPHTDFQRAYQRFLASTARMPVPAGLRRRVFEAILAEEASLHAAPSPPLAGRWNVRALLGRIFRRS